MTHVLTNYSNNYRVCPQIVVSFLINLANLKHSHYIECIVYFNTNFKSHNALYFRMEGVCVYLFIIPYFYNVICYYWLLIFNLSF